MRTRIAFTLSVISFPVFLCTAPAPVRAEVVALPSVILSEIQIEGKTINEDFIELFNPSASSTVELKNFNIIKKTSGGSPDSIKSSFTTETIPPEGFFLLANQKASAELLALADTPFNKDKALSSNNAVEIQLKNGTVVDSIAWGSLSVSVVNPAKNTSLTRDLDTLAWSVSSSPTPTNRKGETYPVPPPPPPVVPPVPPVVPPDPTPPPATPPPLPPDPIVLPAPAPPTAVRLNEIFPNPKTKNDIGEFIELFNAGAEPADVSDWILRDGSATGKFIIPSGSVIAPAAYLVFTDKDFTFTLNNTDETVSLSDQHDTLVDRMTYAASKDDVSLNFTPTGWRGGTPTPGAPNSLNSLPTTRERVPDRGWHGTPVAFDARGRDRDGDALKYRWDFGDGHKSYAETPSHTYEQNGRYTVTLVTSDGKEDLVETFRLRIEDFPHPDLHIVALLPNPDGNDAGSEWIEIENRGKKAINLNGYSLATGWKKLANHPIRADLVVKPRARFRLTSAAAAFSFPNRKARIELRAPDGETLYAVAYKLKAPVEAGLAYIKEKGSGWQWQPIPKTEKETAAPVAAALPDARTDEIPIPTLAPEAPLPTAPTTPLPTAPAPELSVPAPEPIIEIPTTPETMSVSPLSSPLAASFATYEARLRISFVSGSNPLLAVLAPLKNTPPLYPVVRFVSAPHFFETFNASLNDFFNARSSGIVSQDSL